LSRANVKELIKSCGGQVVDHRRSAKYIIASKHKGNIAQAILEKNQFIIVFCFFSFD